MTLIYNFGCLIDRTNPVKSVECTRICTQLTFDLILGFGDISKLGIHTIILKIHQETL